MQPLNGNAGFPDWRHIRGGLLSIWKEVLIVALLACLGALAAALTKMPASFAGDVPHVRDNICRGSPAS